MYLIPTVRSAVGLSLHVQFVTPFVLGELEAALVTLQEAYLKAFLRKHSVHVQPFSRPSSTTPSPRELRQFQGSPTTLSVKPELEGNYLLLKRSQISETEMVQAKELLLSELERVAIASPERTREVFVLLVNLSIPFLLRCLRRF